MRTSDTPAQRSSHHARRRGQPVRVVVDDHRITAVDPPAPGRRLEVLDLRQRMAAVGRRPRPGQFRFHIDEPRPRDVTVEVVLVSVWIAKSPPHIEQHRRGGREQPFQFGRIDHDEGERIRHTSSAASP